MIQKIHALRMRVFLCNVSLHKVVYIKYVGLHNIFYIISYKVYKNKNF